MKHKKNKGYSKNDMAILRQINEAYQLENKELQASKAELMNINMDLGLKATEEQNKKTNLCNIFGLTCSMQTIISLLLHRLEQADYCEFSFIFSDYTNLLLKFQAELLNTISELPKSLNYDDNNLPTDEF